MEDASQVSSPPSGMATLSSQVFTDTVTYGGTWWAADSLRWEALRDSHWSFDTGVGSAFGPTGPNKPAGYHTRMEGWTGLDLSLKIYPYFRRSTTCAINGSYSYWAGVTLSEANGLCFAAGQGYGNIWNMEIRKTFAYGGAGNAGLSYQYAADLEPGFDYAYTVIDTTGSGIGNEIELAAYSGISSGTASIDLVRGTSLRSTPGNVIIKFIVRTDGSYSDEDGLYTTTCGAFVVDDISLTGAIVDFSSFENGPDGWAYQPRLTGRGDFSDIVNMNTDLPPPATFCACGVRDSVLVFFDEVGGHPDDQNNVAYSPWIDLKRGGDVGRSGRLMLYDIYAEMPLSHSVFVQIQARFYPSVCPHTGLLVTTPFRDQNIIFYFGNDNYCNAPGAPRSRDYSSVIDPIAEQVQISFGMISFCGTFPPDCDGISNTTPWLDNIGLGVYGPKNAPNVSLSTPDFLQDNFAEDGTLNPGSTGRLDTSRIKNGLTPGPGTILGDTLVARGNGGNTEVRLVFRVRPGPFTNAGALAGYAAQWTPEAALGAGWYSARMDTAQQGPNPANPVAWMATFHEDDPGFSGTDTSPDPADPSQLGNEILPDHLFTPGSRIDYFVKSRYLPPDPRNPGGTSWWVFPDTSGGRYAEVEILPSSMDLAGTWNPTLYVDHHDDRERDQQSIEELGLAAALGTGSSNAEGTNYDRYDVRSPAATQACSFGRPAGSEFGANLLQALGYRTIAWHSGGLTTNQISNEDAAVLSPWLAYFCQSFECPPHVNRRFWGSGDGLATSMNSGSVSVQNFMKNDLGVLRTCNTIREANCPSSSVLDSTYCLPVATTTGAEFATATLTSVRGNGCPDLRSFDVLSPNPAVSSARGQLEYLKSSPEVGFASITNLSPATCAKSVLDGFGVGLARSRPADPHSSAQCTNHGASVARTAEVLAWLALPCATSDVPGPGNGGSPYRTALGPAHPNPMAATTRIAFTLGVDSAPVRLQIFDVTGRLVRTLVDAPLVAGPHEIQWNGLSDDGSSVSNGLYFYRLSASDGVHPVAQKLIVMR